MQACRKHTNLQNGLATLSVELPVNCRVGDRLQFLAITTDSSRTDPFENRFAVRIAPAVNPTGTSGQRRKPPGNQNGEDREVTAGIALPVIIEVYQKDWESYSPRFDKYTALRIKNAGDADENGKNGDAKVVYDFYINVDNIYLKTEMKPANHDPAVTRARFTYGMVLVGLALLQQEELDRKARAKQVDGDDDEESNIELRVEQLTRAIAPVLLPMIESLGDLDDDSAVSLAGAGEAT